MKFATAVAFLAAVVNYASADSAEAKATIDITCQGVDFGALSPTEHEFTSAILQGTYNALQRKMGHAGTELAHLHFGAAELTSGAGFSGDWGCGMNCGDADSSSLKTEDVEFMSEWANMFIDAAIVGPHSTFYQLDHDKCSIGMSLDNNESDNAGLDRTRKDKHKKNDIIGDLRFGCEGIDFSTLSKSEDDYIGELILESFNRLEARMGHPDVKINKIAYDGASLIPLAQGKLGISYWSSWTFYWGCSFWCPTDDDIDDQFRHLYDDDRVKMVQKKGGLRQKGGDRPKFNEEWANLIVHQAMAGPYPVFHGLGYGMCEISLGDSALVLEQTFETA